MNKGTKEQTNKQMNNQIDKQRDKMESENGKLKWKMQMGNAEWAK
jgi:hypothetical protein